MNSKRGLQSARCSYCLATHHPDLSCRFCSEMRRARFDIESMHRGTGLQHQNLVKLAGHLAAGIHSAFGMAEMRGGFYPTKQELDTALEWAVEQFRSTDYALREIPNGSMSVVDGEESK